LVVLPGPPPGAYLREHYHNLLTACVLRWTHSRCAHSPRTTFTAAAAVIPSALPLPLPDLLLLHYTAPYPFTGPSTQHYHLRPCTHSYLHDALTGCSSPCIATLRAYGSLHTPRHSHTAQRYTAVHLPCLGLPHHLPRAAHIMPYRLRVCFLLEPHYCRFLRLPRAALRTLLHHLPPSGFWNATPAWVL